jgi:hypothetical protein
MTIQTSLAALALAAIPFLATACDEADEVIDCTQICERYQDCVDDEYDVDDCVDRCETNADEDEDFAEATDACETCLDDQSCGESFDCVDECVGIVP